MTSDILKRIKKRINDKSEVIINIKSKDDIIEELQAEIEFQRDLLSEPCNECKKKIKRFKNWNTRYEELKNKRTNTK